MTRYGYWCGAALALLIGSGAAWGQSKEGRLPAEALRGSDSTIFNELRTGARPVASLHEPILQKAANYYVYRLTWSENQRHSVDHNTSGKPMHQLVHDLFNVLPDYKRTAIKEPAKADRQRQFVEEFSKYLVQCIDKVLQGGEIIARVNAARMLARLGDYGIEELGDALTAVLKDAKQSDAVKYWAALGMRDYLASMEKFKNEERELNCVQALLGYLHRPSPLTKETPPEEVAAFHYVRRAFIAALGQERKATVVVNRKVVCRPALEVLRILSKEALDPPPSISEQVEAACGLGNVQAKQFDPNQPDYYTDYAAYHLGHFIVEFAAAYNAERVETNPIKREPWKIHATRLQQALQNIADSKRDAYVANLQSRADGYLESIRKGDAVAIKPFADWLAQNQPKNKSLYKGDPKATAKEPTVSEN